MNGLVRLRQVADVFNGKTPSKADQRSVGHPVLKIRDVDDNGRYRGHHESFVEPELAARYQSKWVLPGDTLILNAAHNAAYVASKSSYVDLQMAGALATGEWLVVRPNPEVVLPAFVNFWLRCPIAKDAIRFLVKGIHLYPKDVAELELELPGMEHQRRIVELLSRANSIVHLRREARQKAAELTPAIFVEMFGDPATNPLNWPMVSLGEVAEVQGGLQVSRARDNLPIERPYLRVANVHRGRLDLEEVKTIRLTEAEFSRTRLARGDLLFVEGHGNPLEVGRVAIWGNEIANCTHQNHLIRARVDASRLRPAFACSYLNSAGGRQALLRSGKTTSGLSTISTSNVKSAPIALPPLQLQLAFERHVAAIEGIVAQQQGATERAAAAFAALLGSLFPAHQSA